MAGLSALRRLGGPALSDLAQQQQEPVRTPAEEFVRRNDGPLVRGLASAVSGISAGETANEALAAEQRGDMETASALRQRAAELQQEVGTLTPRVRSLSDIQDLSTAGEFAQYALGQGVGSTLPSIAGAVAGRFMLPGRVFGPAGLRSFIGASVPAYRQERGEAVLGQYNDPEAMARPADERAAVASLKGGVNAALEAVVPAALTSRFGRAAREGVLPQIGKAALEEGTTELAQQRVGQIAAGRINPNRDISHDAQERLDAFAMGAIGGGGMATPGAAVGAVPAAIDKVLNSEFFNDAKARVDQRLSRNRLMNAGNDMASVGASFEETMNNLRTGAETATRDATETIKRLMADPDVSPDIKEQLAPLDPSSPEGQKVVGSVESTLYADREGPPAVDDFTENVKKTIKRMNEQSPEAAQAVQDAITPFLRPEIMGSSKAVAKLPELSLAVGNLVARGNEVDDDAIRAFGGFDSLETLTDDPEGMLEAVAATTQVQGGLYGRFRDFNRASQDAEAPERAYFVKALGPQMLGYIEKEYNGSAQKLLYRKIGELIDAVANGRLSTENRKHEMALHELDKIYNSRETASSVVEFYRKANRNVAPKSMERSRGQLEGATAPDDIIESDEAAPTAVEGEPLVAAETRKRQVYANPEKKTPFFAEDLEKAKMETRRYIGPSSSPKMRRYGDYIAETKGDLLGEASRIIEHFQELNTKDKARRSDQTPERQQWIARREKAINDLTTAMNTKAVRRSDERTHTAKRELQRLKDLRGQVREEAMDPEMLAQVDEAIAQQEARVKEFQKEFAAGRGVSTSSAKKQAEKAMIEALNEFVIGEVEDNPEVGGFTADDAFMQKAKAGMKKRWRDEDEIMRFSTRDGKEVAVHVPSMIREARARITDDTGRTNAERTLNAFTTAVAAVMDRPEISGVVDPDNVARKVLSNAYGKQRDEAGERVRVLREEAEAAMKEKDQGRLAEIQEQTTEAMADLTALREHNLTVQQLEDERNLRQEKIAYVDELHKDLKDAEKRVGSFQRFLASWGATNWATHPNAVRKVAGDMMTGDADEIPQSMLDDVRKMMARFKSKVSRRSEQLKRRGVVAKIKAQIARWSEEGFSTYEFDPDLLEGVTDIFDAAMNQNPFQMQREEQFKDYNVNEPGKAPALTGPSKNKSRPGEWERKDSTDIRKQRITAVKWVGRTARKAMRETLRELSERPMDVVLKLGREMGISIVENKDKTVSVKYDNVDAVMPSKAHAQRLVAGIVRSILAARRARELIEESEERIRKAVEEEAASEESLAWEKEYDERKAREAKMRELEEEVNLYIDNDVPFASMLPGIDEITSVIRNDVRKVVDDALGEHFKVIGNYFPSQALGMYGFEDKHNAEAITLFAGMLALNYMRGENGELSARETVLRVLNHEIMHSAITRIERTYGVEALTNLMNAVHAPEVLDQVLKASDVPTEYLLQNNEELLVETYSLWTQGRVKLESQPKLKGFFTRIKEAVQALLRLLTGDKLLSEVFHAVQTGELKGQSYDKEQVYASLIERAAGGFFTYLNVTELRNEHKTLVAEKAKRRMNEQYPLAKYDGGMDDITQQKIREVIARMRGNEKIRVILDKTFQELGGSGSWEMDPQTFERVIHVAANASDPLSVAYHEALHDFFGTLVGKGSKTRKLKDDLTAVSTSPAIKAQLRKLLANHPKALAALDDPNTGGEETLAYAFQFWASGDLRVGPSTKGFFQTLFKMIRNLLGVMTTDEKVAAIFKALHDGKLKNPNTVAEVLVDERIETVRDKATRLAAPLVNAADKMLMAASDRLRNMNSKALAEVADMFHLEPGREKGELGFLQKRAQIQGQWLNRLQNILDKSTAAERRKALEELQSMTPDTQASALTLQLREYLDDGFEYLTKAGVKRREPNPEFVPGNGEEPWVEVAPRKVKDYAPRVWDTSRVRANREKLEALFVRDGKMDKKEASDIVDKILGHSGQEDILEGLKQPVGFTPWQQAILGRQLTFIRANNAKDYAEFQEKDLVNVMTQYTQQLVHRGEYTKRFGNWGEVLREKFKEAKAEGLTETELIDAAKTIQAMEGTLGWNMDERLRGVMTGLITYENIVLLPFSLFSNLIDPLGVGLRTGDMKDAWDTLKNGLKGLLGDIEKAEGYQLARDLGIIDENNMVEAMGMIYNGKYMSGAMRKINHLFFKFNGMDQWNKRMRLSAMLAGQRFIEKHAAGHNEHSKRYMEELGLENWTPVYDQSNQIIPDARYQEALFRFVDGAILRPNAAQRPVWGSDPHWMLVFHLKQFTFSFQQTILKRVGNELAHGNTQAAWILASYVPFMMASDLLRGLLTGGTRVNWDFWDYLANGITRSGVLGIGSFATDALTDASFGQAPGLSLLGPTAGHAIFAAETLGPQKDFADLLLRSAPASPLVKSML